MSTYLQNCLGSITSHWDRQWDPLSQVLPAVSCHSSSHYQPTGTSLSASRSSGSAGQCRHSDYQECNGSPGRPGHHTGFTHLAYLISLDLQNSYLFPFMQCIVDSYISSSQLKVLPFGISTALWLFPYKYNQVHHCVPTQWKKFDAYIDDCILGHSVPQVLRGTSPFNSSIGWFGWSTWRNQILLLLETSLSSAASF